MRGILILLLGILVAFASCNDHNPPSPQEIVLSSNVLRVKGLSDPCKVAHVEVIIGYKNRNVTIFTTNPHKPSVDFAVTLPSPPYTLIIKYWDEANNTGALKWNIRYLPYIPYTLEKMVVQGTRGLVLVNPPPSKPALPREYGDVSYQNGAWLLVAIVAFIVGAVRQAWSRRSS